MPLQLGGHAPVGAMQNRTGPARLVQRLETDPEGRGGLRLAAQSGEGGGLRRGGGVSAQTCSPRLDTVSFVDPHHTRPRPDAFSRRNNMKMRSRWAAMRLWPPDPLVGRPEQR